MFQKMRIWKIGAMGSSQHPYRGEWVWKALAALAIGALLGALAMLPYDRLLGMPGATGTVLRSLVATVVLAGMKAGHAQDMVFDVAGLPQGSLQAGDRLCAQKSVSCRNIRRVLWSDEIRIACRSLRGNLNRRGSVLNMQAEAMIAPHGG